MVRYLPIVKLVLILGLLMLLVMLLVSGCDVSDLFGDRGPDRPTEFALLAPVESTVLVQSPVQIQTALPAVDISRVELRVQGPGDESPRLIRSDVPVDGYLVQEWRPLEPGTYIIQVLPYGPQENLLANLSRQFQVIQSPAVVLQELEPIIPREELSKVPQGPLAKEVLPIEPTVVLATPTAITGEAEQQTTVADAEVAVVSVVISPTLTPEPVLLYPPPPPAPGVPPGSDKSDPDYGPPACDAAAYEGVYEADTRRRILITEKDKVPARVVAGSTVFRAWRLRNIGLCTWGPGYELAFYGGRSMGSGGVAFESTFPSEPLRRNVILDANRLIVPEARPNEVAVPEVLLNVPATPGIHQSYWRMRNPAGIYFGPIIGVTLDVVRECEWGIYGAPVINQFEIIGVGNVYRPENPVSVLAEVGDRVTLRYNIINAQNFDIIFEGPTGTLSSETTTDPSGDAYFVPPTVGRYTITLYADNGVCTAQAQVFVDALPSTDEQFFTLNIVLSTDSACTGSTAPGLEFSSALAPGDVVARWQHSDQGVTEATLVDRTYRPVEELECPVVESIFGWQGHCYNVTNWRAVGQPVGPVVGEQGAAAGQATIANLEDRQASIACTSGGGTQFGMEYVMRAQKNGVAAKPEYSNTVQVLCNCPGATPNPRIEIIEGGASGFDPQ